MLFAIGSTTRGGQVVIEGSSVEKAQVVLGHLREHGIIDF
jgi:electron transfer flavoprotein beta subunit